MKRLCSFLLLIVLCLGLYGCSEDLNYYFTFKFDSLTCYVGDSFNVFDKDFESNVSSYAQLHIYSSDDNVVEVSNYVLNVKSVGSATITVSGVVNHKFVSDNFVVVAKSIFDEDQNNDEDQNANLQIKNLLIKDKEGGYSIATFDVYMGNETYSLFSYDIKEGGENITNGPSHFSNQFEFSFVTGTHVKITIYNQDFTKSTQVFV